MNSEIMKMDPVAVEAAQACADRVTAVWYEHMGRVTEKYMARGDAFNRMRYAGYEWQVGRASSPVEFQLAKRAFAEADAAARAAREERRTAIRAVMAEYGVDAAVVMLFTGPDVAGAVQQETAWTE